MEFLKTSSKMKLTQIDLAEVRSFLVKYLTPKNICKLTLASLASVFLYTTTKLYLKRRQYRHIPGPKTNGFEITI